MRLLSALPLLLAVLLASLAGPARAQDEEPAPRLRVGTKEAPPFALRTAEGEWRGIAVDLWRDLAADLGLAHEWVERDLEGLIEGVADGSLDAAVAALTVTHEREERLDFTHAFQSSGLGIAVAAERRSGWGAVLDRLLSLAFLEIVLALVGVLAVVGGLIWLFERRRNRAQFGQGVGGLGSGFWWSAVTMTTVGYGDKAPQTVPGRVVALLWMFASLLLIAVFTAAVTSALTVSELEGTVRGPEDLPGLRVATVPDSTSERYLVRRRIARKRYPDAREALLGLLRGEVDAVVYDRPLLEYVARHDADLHGRVEVLPRTFERQDYAIALPPASSLREPLNRALLQHLESDRWAATLERYLGR